MIRPFGGQGYKPPMTGTILVAVTALGMPRPKSEFPQLHPCDFYTPAELLEPDQMYTVYEIARLLQDLEPDAELEPETEEILLDWTIPWIMHNADELVVADPADEAEPGYYGLAAG